MKIITSLDNSLIKKLRSLSVKKYREQFGLCLLEGNKVVLEALKRTGLVEYLIISNDNQEVLESLSEYNSKILVVSPEIFRSLSSTITPQEIMACINITKEKPLESTDNLLVLDHLQDPGNLGTIIRSAVASGHTEIVLIDSVDPYNAKTIRSASGTIFDANFHTIKKPEFIDFVKNNGYEILVADMGGIDIFNPNCNINYPYALIIGNEGNGVSKEFKTIATKTIAIPMLNDVESLNAGVSASIIMFNLTNKKGK